MSLASGSIDLKSLKIAGEPNKYITQITGAGIKVHDAGDTNNYIQINSSGMKIYKGGTADSNIIASFSSTIQIGKTAEAHINITAGGLDVYNGSNQISNLISHLGYDPNVDSGATPYFTLGKRAVNLINSQASTIIPGYYSVVEGLANIAEGQYSHAEGAHTEAVGNYSHAEGTTTFAIGSYSHTEGSGTYAIGDGSHAGGRESRAGGYDSQNRKIGDFSFVHGDHVEASGTGQAVFGKYNKISSDALFIIGNGSESNRSNLMEVGTDLIRIGNVRSDHINIASNRVEIYNKTNSTYGVKTIITTDGDLGYIKNEATTNWSIGGLVIQNTAGTEDIATALIISGASDLTAVNDAIDYIERPASLTRNGFQLHQYGNSVFGVDWSGNVNTAGRVTSVGLTSSDTITTSSTISATGDINTAGNYKRNNKSFLTVESKSFNWTFAASTSQEKTGDVSKTGYTPIGIVGFDINNQTSGGHGSSLRVMACRLNGTNVLFQAQNDSTSSAAQTIYFWVLYMAT